MYDKLEDISHYELVEINDEKSWRENPTAKNTNMKPEGMIFSWKTNVYIKITSSRSLPHSFTKG